MALAKQEHPEHFVQTGSNGKRRVLAFVCTEIGQKFLCLIIKSKKFKQMCYLQCKHKLYAVQLFSVLYKVGKQLFEHWTAYCTPQIKVKNP